MHEATAEPLPSPQRPGPCQPRHPGWMTFGTHRMDRGDLLFYHVLQAVRSAGHAAHRGLASTLTQPWLPQFEAWAPSARSFALSALSALSSFAWHCWLRPTRPVLFPDLIGLAGLADFPMCRVPLKSDTSRSGLRTQPARSACREQRTRMCQAHWQDYLALSHKRSVTTSFQLWHDYSRPGCVSTRSSFPSLCGGIGLTKCLSLPSYVYV